MNTKTLRTILKILVRSGAAAGAGNLVSNNGNHSQTKIVDDYHRAASFCGGAAVGWMVGDIAADYAEKKFDETVEALRDFKQSLKK